MHSIDITNKEGSVSSRLEGGIKQGLYHEGGGGGNRQGLQHGGGGVQVKI